MKSNLKARYVCMYVFIILSIFLIHFKTAYAISGAIIQQYDFNTSDGSTPLSTLIESGGKFYGTAYSGGANGVGTLFEWDPNSNTITKQHDFNTTDGINPQGALLAYNGKFYGTTSGGGLHGYGTIFEWDSSSNTITKQYDLGASDGQIPGTTLVEYNGKLYGNTSQGGTHTVGTLFEWDPVSNTITKQYNFNSTDGENPYGFLTEVGGDFYGTTANGGLNGHGEIYEWDPVSNTIIKQYDFNESDGAFPANGLIENNGLFYSTTVLGGTSDYGTIFEWDPVSNTITKQYKFNNTDGSSPYASLVLYNGKFYGANYGGGANGVGTLFEWDPVSNTITKQYDFNTTDGSSPYSPLTLYNGKFYSTASAGGTNNVGTIFAWDGGLYTLPLVSTLSVSNTTVQSATLNANITDSGGQNDTSRGFNWGLTNSYGQTTTESGSFSAGSFSADITGLTCDTAYHFQAYAINTAGTGTSTPDATFVTSACPAAPVIVLPHGGGHYIPPSPPPSVTVTPAAVVAGPSAPYIPQVCASYLNSYIKLGADNNADDVKKLQTFLNTYAGENLAVDGVYKQADFDAVERLQASHIEILNFWNLTHPTGYVYIATQKTVNRLYCEKTTNLTCPYFTGYEKQGDTSAEVAKIKTFLNNTQGEKLDITSGTFDSALFDAVKRFQTKYASNVLIPWGRSIATGWWYESTEKKANDLVGCFAPVRLDNGTVIP